MNRISIQPAPAQPGTFHQMSHAASRDSRVSFEARGLLLYLHSRGTGWRITDSELRAQGLGRERARRVLKELEDAGYLVRGSIRDAKTQRFGGSSWTISLYPNLAAEPVTENPPTAQPTPDSQRPETDPDSVNHESANHLSVNPDSVKQESSEESSSVDAREGHNHDDDDDILFGYIKDCFGGFTADQQAIFEKQRARLGDENVKTIAKRVLALDAVKRPLPFFLTSLCNERVRTTPPPSSAPPPAPISHDWQTPAPDAGEAQSQSADADPIDEPVMTTQRERDCWNLVMTQIKHQWDRVTFEAWLGRAVLKRVDVDGRYVVQVGSEQAAQMLSTRLYRNVRRVLADVTAHPDIEITFESAPPPKPPKWLYPETPKYAGGAS